ncbi:MAG: DMT family transporter [Candidatus Roizmanbacteria bacterium]|nr:DMT family transporter [Candidatus Roizmanbacteria bacterium]
MGILYVIIADILWAGEIIFTKKFFSDRSPVLVAAFASFFGALFYIPTLITVKEKITSRDIILFVIMGIFVYVIPQIFYVKGIQETKSSVAVSLVSLTIPIFTSLFSIFVLKEAITLKLVIGSILVAGGFIVISLP